MDGETTAKVKNALKNVEKSIEKRPMIYIAADGTYRLNEPARSFIAEGKIPRKEFMEWLIIGSAHLQKLSYGNVKIQMMRLPDSDVVAFLGRETSKQPDGKKALTEKERAILRYVVKGHSNKQIAQNLDISPGTVNTHLDSIYRKMGCSNRVAAAFLGLKHGHYLPACERKADASKH